VLFVCFLISRVETKLGVKVDHVVIDDMEVLKGFERRHVEHVWAGLTILRNEVVTFTEPEGPVQFHWILAHK